MDTWTYRKEPNWIPGQAKKSKEVSSFLQMKWKFGKFLLRNKEKNEQINRLWFMLSFIGFRHYWRLFIMQIFSVHIIYILFFLNIRRFNESNNNLPYAYKMNHILKKKVLQLILDKQKLKWSKMITHLPCCRSSSICITCIADLSTIRGTQSHSGFL